MGLDLVVLSNHKMDVEVHEMKDEIFRKLNTLGVYKNDYLKSYFVGLSKDEWTQKSWSLETYGMSSIDEIIEKTNSICIEGPWAITLYFGKYGYEINLNARWYHFIKDKRLYKNIIDLLKFLNSSFGGDKMIFIPDNATQTSTYSEYLSTQFNFTLEEILQKMKEELGEPCKNINQLEYDFFEIEKEENYLYLTNIFS